LIDPGSFRQPENPDSFQDPQGAEGIGIGGVFRRFEAHSHVALGPQVVDLVGLDLLDDLDQVAAVGQIAVMQEKAAIPFMGVLIQVIDSCGVEAAGPAFDAVHHIALLEKKLSEITAVLACDAANQGDGRLV